MKSVFARVAGEPLVQFLAVGAVVVALAGLAERGGEPTTSPDRVVVDAERLAQLRELVSRSWARDPTPQEMNRVVEAYVREEILAREARKLGLAEDDSVIRQRLAQKMEFLLEPPPGTLEPTDAELADYLEANIARYRKEPRIALAQVYLSPHERGAALGADAAAILAALEDGADPSTLGDQTLLPMHIATTSLGNIRRVYGPDFAEALMALPVGEWAGPVRSGHGEHLVRIEEREDPVPPTVESEREALTRDYRIDREQAYVDARFAELKSRYEVIVEQAPPEQAGDPTDGAPDGSGG